MPFDVGINFRATAGFVTDGPGQTYSLGETTDQTRGGTTFRWSDAVAGMRDRFNTAPWVPEFAGIAFCFDGAPRDFSIDLPAPGTYEVHLAIGDAVAAQPGQYCHLYDGSTLLAEVCSDLLVPSNQFCDATGVIRSSADDWRANEQPRSVTLAGTVLSVRLGDGVGVSNSSTIAHLRVVQKVGGRAPIAVFMHHYNMIRSQ